jgi:hypothetical protein
LLPCFRAHKQKNEKGKENIKNQKILEEYIYILVRRIDQNAQDLK